MIDRLQSANPIDGGALSWLDRGLQFPPPGRVRMSWDEARTLLVEHRHFRSSQTRRELWSGLEGYVFAFEELGRQHPELTEDSLIHCLWIAGSYVSNKIDPRNIDLTVILDGPSLEALHGRPGAGALRRLFNRDRALRDFNVSPVAMRYYPVRSVFKSHDRTADEEKYFVERGKWDDWWQRTRDPELPGVAPTVDTAVARRGYLEVIP